MEGRYVLCLFVVLFHIHCAQCYSSGAPWYTCITMFPVHNDVQQQPALSSPFQVIADQTSYFPGTILQLKINSTMSGRTFKGFQMRARPVNGDTEQVVGQFVNASTNVSRTLDCLGDVQHVVTNRDATPKVEVTLTWMMSESNFGNIEFVVTFVEDFNTFWTEVTTQITVIGVADESNAEIVSTEFNDINWDSCGSEKGCFLYPRLCSGSNCYTGLTYQITNESLRFEMFGPQLGYIAVGFSEDKLLGYDEMISCTGDGDILSIQRGYSTDDAFFERQYKNGITNIQVSIQDDKLYCSFTRPVSLNIFNEGHTTQTMVDLTQSYYIMLAWGDVFDGTDVLRQYKELPPITDEMVDLSAKEIVRGSSMPWETKIHGTMMLLAWFLLTSVSIIIARHFKGMYQDALCFGSRVWIQIHRGLAITSWLLTVAGFILIFIHVGKMTENAKIHSYLGITVMSASTLQIFMGILRPEQESSKYIVYIWSHWFLGRITHIIAGVTVFFAFYIEITPKPQKYFSYIVLGVYTGVLIFWDIFFDVTKRCRNRNSSEKYDVKSMTLLKRGSTTNKNTTGSYIAFILYVLCMLGITTAAIICIYLF